MKRDPGSNPPPASGSQPEEQQGAKGLFKRFTRLRSPSGGNTPSQPVASSSSSPAAVTNDPPTKRRKSVLKLPSLPKPQGPAPVNAWTSPELRQAALRERGLIPAVPRVYRDEHGYMLPLSQQEAVIDQRRSVLVPAPGHESDEDVESEAKKIREAWLRKNADESLPPPPEEQVASSSASERASAFAATEDSMVIGIQRSPVRGTFVQVMDSPHMAPIIPDLQTPADTTTTNTRSTREPHEVPLPTSPTPTAAHADEPASPLSTEVSTWLKLSDEDSLQQVSTAPSTASKPTRPQPPPSMPIIQEDHPSLSGTSTPLSTSSPNTPTKSTDISTSQTISIPASLQTSVIPEPLQSPPLDFEDPRSPRAAALPKLSISPPTNIPPTSSPNRGRSLTTYTNGAVSLAPSASTSSAGSRVPALSPTRTSSSSMSCSEVPPTPSGTSFSRRRKSSAISDDSLESPTRNRHAKVLGIGQGGLHIRTTGEDVDILKPTATAIVVESPVELTMAEEAEREDVLPSMRSDVSSPTSLTSKVSAPSSSPTPRPRTNISVTSETRDRRASVSFGSLFGKGHSSSLPSDDSLKPPTSPKPSRSMSNLRKSVGGAFASKLRPKSTLVVNTTAAKQADFSRLPPSPAPAPAGSMSPGVGLRPPRQALSPTIHNRGSILLSTKNIEDDESRRLSEMAFLDF
ncbi:hypothetical protein BXZ70DRAFT_1007886 [Cristinia sonorae]|uniref:Uncharacterized protein n=1 Tax=Cristinia sonorae TaxID=1940300 RepID=A0A8K0UP97_9AGAR|nr:hypothetical protein BXZ70DRAFT_1007886 [Cristinia sonorae]